VQADSGLHDYSKNLMSSIPPEIVHKHTSYVVCESLILVSNVSSLTDRLERIVNQDLTCCYTLSSIEWHPDIFLLDLNNDILDLFRRGVLTIDGKFLFWYSRTGTRVKHLIFTLCVGSHLSKYTVDLYAISFISTSDSQRKHTTSTDKS